MPWQEGVMPGPIGVASLSLEDASLTTLDEAKPLPRPESHYVAGSP